MAAFILPTCLTHETRNDISQTKKNIHLVSARFHTPRSVSYVHAQSLQSYQISKWNTSYITIHHRPLWHPSPSRIEEPRLSLRCGSHTCISSPLIRTSNQLEKKNSPPPVSSACNRARGFPPPPLTGCGAPTVVVGPPPPPRSGFAIRPKLKGLDATAF